MTRHSDGGHSTARLHGAFAGRLLSSLAAACAAVALGGCATRPPGAAVPDWRDDDLAGLPVAMARQCALPRPPPPWARLCPDLPTDPARLRSWISRRMRFEALAGDDGSRDGLVTGYYEPEVAGSLRHRSAGQVPLYKRPPAAFLAARPTRDEIERGGSLAGSELVWIDDPVDAFFLQIQGSGRVLLHGGGEMRVGFAGDNGRPYHPIGRTLVERGAIAAGAADAKAIADWLHAHPGEAADVMSTNPRYVFFRELPAVATDQGPPGALGIPLTPLRSVAADPRRVPPGSLLFVETTWPVGERPLRRFVLAQDTGAAIRGAVRIDLFFGRGAQAKRTAGEMKQRGRIWILRPANAN